MLTKTHFLSLVVQDEDGDPCMHSAVEEMNGTDHQGQSYIIRVMKTSWLIISNTGYICHTPMTTEQYLLEQIIKVAGLLGNIFTQAGSVRQDQVFHLCFLHTQKHSLHNNRWKESMQSTTISRAVKLTPDVFCLIASQTVPQEVIHPRTWSLRVLKPYKSEIRTQSDWISCKLERLGVSNIRK